MEENLSEVLDDLLGLLLLEGSYEIEEDKESAGVLVETKDAGRLIGYKGESLEALQLIVNQMMLRKLRSAGKEESLFKRVILDVEGWKKQKEEDLKKRAEEWAKQVLQNGKEMELEPLPAWQRRIVHMVVGEMGDLSTESVGEGRDRHIVIKIKDQSAKIKNKNKDAAAENDGQESDDQQEDTKTKPDSVEAEES